MPPFQPFAAPWSRSARRDNVPKTPEPALEGAEQPPSPPRLRFRVKRRNASNLNAPTQQFLASVAAEDIPIPSIEEPRVLDEEMEDSIYPISQLSEMEDIPLTPHGGSDRMFSPPKTPAPGVLPELSPKQYPNWSIDSTLSSLESSPDYESSRPSTAHSTHTSTSLLSYFSISSEELSQCVSPETEKADHFGELSSTEDNDKTIKAAKQEVAKDTLRRAPWTKPMVQHLWSTYMMYLQDPKVTPFRLGKSGIPPHGVCLRVAREAKRSWKGSKAQGNVDQNSGSITPTAQAPTGPYVQWPHTCAATRAQLRELCRMNTRTNARNNQYLAPSPTPYGKSAARYWNRRTGPALSPEVFSGQDMALSLAVSTSDSMQLQGPLAQLSNSQFDPQPEELPLPPPNADMSAPVTGPEPLESERTRLASPFGAQSYGPSSSGSLPSSFVVDSKLQRQTHTGGPRRTLMHQGLLDKATYHRFATGYDRVNEEPDNLIVNQATMFVTERYSDHTYQGQMPDTGASTISTVGIGQARALMRECPSVRFDTAKARNNTVRFGDGPKVECLGTVTVTGPLGEITYHVIEGNTPFLFCLKDMDEKGIYFDNIANELVNSRTGARVEVTRKFGHGWFHTSIANDAASYFNEAELRRLHKRFGHPSVAKLEALLIRAGHETDRDALEAIRKMCHYCQTKGSAGKRFRFTLKREADFNYEVIVDVMYLDNKPVLHIVDAGTSFQAARFLRSISAKETWEKLKECWIDAYLGPPDIISHDAGTNFDSAEFRAEAKLAGITINQIPVEAHWSIGKVERYHGPLRRAYEIIRSETKKAETSQEACLQMAVKAINDTSGPDGLVPTLLVFGAYPRISKDSPPTASQQQRAAAAAKAMTEVRKLRAAKEVREALNTRNGQDTSATLPESLPLGSEVLVYREKEKWTGPFKVLAVTESNVTVELDNGPATFRSTTIKPYHRDSTRTIVVSTGSTEDLSVPQDDIEEYPERKKKRPRGRPRKVRDAEAFVTHKERAEYELALQLRKEGRIVTPGRPFEISDAAEIDALFDTGVLVAVHIDEVDKDNAQFFGSRIVREVKGKTTVPYEKSRLVVRGFQDHAKTAILTQAPTIQRASQHTLLALGPTLRRFGHEVMLRDISQAYTQSETQLNRRIYLRLPPELTEKYPEGIVLKVEKPLYGLAEAGLHWYATYSKHHRERLGMEPISSDPCLFLTQQDDEFGITAIQTDDTFNIGTEAFIRREDEELKKAGFKAKPQRVMKTGDSCDFNGSYIQFDEESFNCTQKGQADRLQLVDHTATDRQQQYIMQRARGAYLASICQPEASYGYSVAAQVRNPNKGDIAKLNKCIQWQLDNKQRGLRYQEIDLPTAKLFVFVDGSFANNKDLTSQIGYAIVLGNEEVGEDRTVIDQRTDESDHVFTVTGNLVHWSSTKCKRVTRSVLASEVYGMVGGFDLGYVIWHTLGAITQRLGITRPPLILCTDSYSLYQCLVQLGSTTEKRLMIDIMALRQSYETREIHEIRWIKGDDNPADAMTKASPNRALEGLVVEGRISIRLEGWVQRE